MAFCLGGIFYHATPAVIIDLKTVWIYIKVQITGLHFIFRLLNYFPDTQTQ